MTIRLSLRVVEPCTVTDGPTIGNTHRTLDYIPGSSLRGAFAGRYIARHKVDQDFTSFFDGELLVSDARDADRSNCGSPR